MTDTVAEVDGAAKVAIDFNTGSGTTEEHAEQVNPGLGDTHRLHGTDKIGVLDAVKSLSSISEDN